MEDWSRIEIELYNKTQLKALVQRPIWKEVDSFLKENELWIELYLKNEVGNIRMGNGYTKLENYVAQSIKTLLDLRDLTLVEIEEEIANEKLQTLKKCLMKNYTSRLKLKSLVNEKTIKMSELMASELYEFWYQIDKKIFPQNRDLRKSGYALKVLKDVENLTDKISSNPISALLYWIDVRLGRKEDFKTVREARILNGNDWGNWYTSIKNGNGLGYGQKSISQKHINGLEEVLKDDKPAFELLMELQKRINS